MARQRRDRVFVRSEDGKPTVVSSRRGNFAARLCRRHRVRNLADAKAVGLLPGFVNLEVLEKEATRVLGLESFDRDAERLVGELRSTSPGDADGGERLRRARVAAEAVRLRAADLGQVIEPGIEPKGRFQIAGRSLQVLTRAPVDLIRFELDEDLDLYTDLVFARDVTMARFGEVRIYRGARMVGSSSDFFLRTTSIEANLLPPLVGTHVPGLSLNDIARSIA